MGEWGPAPGTTKNLVSLTAGQTVRDAGTIWSSFQNCAVAGQNLQSVVVLGETAGSRMRNASFHGVVPSAMRYCSVAETRPPCIVSSEKPLICLGAPRLNCSQHFAPPGVLQPQAVLALPSIALEKQFLGLPAQREDGVPMPARLESLEDALTQLACQLQPTCTEDSKAAVVLVLLNKTLLVVTPVTVLVPPVGAASWNPLRQRHCATDVAPLAFVSELAGHGVQA